MSRTGPSFSTPRKMGRPTIRIPKKDLLAPEVVDFQLTYYGGTAGTASSGTASGGTASGGTAGSGTASSGTATNGTTSGGTTTVDTTTNGTTSDNQWDSTQQGMLPAAVRISISLRRQAPKSLLSLLDTEKRPPVVYTLLVSLPNSQVDTSQQVDPPEASANVVRIRQYHRTGNRRCSRPR